MFKPVNRHILIDLDQRTDDQKSLIVLPEDYKPEQQKHSVVRVIEKSDDVKPLPIRLNTVFVTPCAALI